MPVTAFLLPLLSFALAFIAHAAVWRRRRPRRQIAALAALFLAGGTILAWLLAFAAGFTPVLRLQAAALHALLASAYILTYPAVQAKCPTLDMVRIIAASGPAGADYPAIAARFPKERLLTFREQDLLDDGLVVELPDGRRVPTRFARAVLAVLGALRAFLDLPPGEG